MEDMSHCLNHSTVRHYGLNGLFQGKMSQECNLHRADLPSKASCENVIIKRIWWLCSYTVNALFPSQDPLEILNCTSCWNIMYWDHWIVLLRGLMHSCRDKLDLVRSVCASLISVESWLTLLNIININGLHQFVQVHHSDLFKKLILVVSWGETQHVYNTSHASPVWKWTGRTADSPVCSVCPVSCGKVHVYVWVNDRTVNHLLCGLLEMRSPSSKFICDAARPQRVKWNCELALPDLV